MHQDLSRATHEEVLQFLLSRKMESVSVLEPSHAAPRRTSSILPSSNYEEVAHTRWKRRLRDVREFVIRWIRFLWNTTVARTKNAYTDYSTREPSNTMSRRARFRMWWQKRGFLVKIALLLSLIFVSLFANASWAFIKQTSAYAKITTMIDMHKNPVLNVYVPPPEGVPILSSRDWLSSLQPLPFISAANISKGYFSCAVHSRETTSRNITLATVLSLLSQACPLSGTCQCIAAGQVGIACPIVLVNRRSGGTNSSTLVLQPEVKEWSTTTQRTRLRVGDETLTLDRPAEILVEHFLSNGYLSRERYIMTEAACVLSAIEFNHDVTPRGMVN